MCLLLMWVPFISEVAGSCLGDQHPDLLQLLAFLHLADRCYCSFTSRYLFICVSTSRDTRMNMSESLGEIFFLMHIPVSPHLLIPNFWNWFLGMCTYILFKIVNSIRAKRHKIFIIHTIFPALPSLRFRLRSQRH